jgi:prepilin-type N-terminal cleavage/methylation domain-containing protein
MNRRNRAFTLVELLVVITIITLLVSLLVVMISVIIDKARYAKTASTVKLLDEGCKTYRLDFGVYPPNDKNSSASLHQHLGVERKITTQRVDLGTPIVSTKPPIIDWQRDMLDDTQGIPDPKNNPVKIMDAFGQPIRYVNPGKYKKGGVDIWSPGKNEKDEYLETAPDYDDVTNWAKDY